MIALHLTGLKEAVLLNVFFTALLNGSFLGDKTPEAGPFQGWSQDTYLEDLFKVVDCWGRPRPDKTDIQQGLTTIFYRDIPIWQMHYSGNYEHEALSYLKVVLHQSYSWRTFQGGRGINMDGGKLCYRNVFTVNTFSNFAGTESIAVCGTTRLLGSHTYFGGYLF